MWIGGTLLAAGSERLMLDAAPEKRLSSDPTYDPLDNRRVRLAFEVSMPG
jgi:hypothetical protein